MKIVKIKRVQFEWDHQWRCSALFEYKLTEYSKHSARFNFPTARL